MCRSCCCSSPPPPPTRAAEPVDLDLEYDIPSTCNALTMTPRHDFAPRVKMPVLMLNGSDDFIRPVATSQRPLFLLGTPGAHKRHVMFPGGHLPPNMEGLIRETRDWLNHYLGAVTPMPAAPR